MSEKRRLTWFILARMIVVSLFFGSAIILSKRNPETFENISLVGLSRLIAATYIFSLTSLAAVRLLVRIRPFLSYIQILWDLLLVTFLILLTGGLSSPYSFLFMLVVISASVLLARRQALYTASLCAILYGGIIDLQYYGKLAVLGLTPNAALQYGSVYLLYTIFVNITAFYLTALLSGYLAERVRSSESALLEKVIDYEELERLNSSIVRNLASGLLTVTNDGRIRVFNRHAEDVTGVTQQDAYDRPVAELFPGIDISVAWESGVLTGETRFCDNSGNELVLAYSAVPFFDKDGARSGIIINFNDLTQIRQMEAELKRADRLAAVGELAARIAHEIRNPLASISGSVQLIAQGEGVPERDRTLLSIVLRETDRLNHLVSDFLIYARPAPPKRELIELCDLYRELEALLKSDPAFQGISVRFACEEGSTVSADRGQIEQVLWNLFANAADAMPVGGEIDVTTRIVQITMRRSEQADFVRIDVRDNGQGMTDEVTRSLFEPFFTTKPGGTGLGLATVYRIIDAHGGRIFVESASGTGTVFSILLPAGLAEVK